MGFEKVKELNADTTIQLKNKGDVLEGYYHGFKEIPSKYGISLLHIFELETGENVGVWGSGRLNYGLKLLTPKNGQAMMLRITCEGTVPSNKGNDAYAYTIEKDKSRLTEAAVAVESDEAAEEEVEEAPRAAAPKAAAPRTFGGSTIKGRSVGAQAVAAEESEEEAVTEIQEEAPRPARVTSSPVHSTSAANKAKVNSILGVGSRKN